MREKRRVSLSKTDEIYIRRQGETSPEAFDRPATGSRGLDWIKRDWVFIIKKTAAFLTAVREPTRRIGQTAIRTVKRPLPRFCVDRHTPPRTSQSLSPGWYELSIHSSHSVSISFQTMGTICFIRSRPYLAASNTPASRCAAVHTTMTVGVPGCTSPRRWAIATPSTDIQRS